MPAKAWLTSPGAKNLVQSVAVVPVVALVGFAVVYLISPIISDCIEPQVAAVAYRAALHHGRIYGPLQDGPQYSLLYGPATYLVHMPLFLLFGGSLFTAKLVGVAALLVSLWSVYRSCRTLASASESIMALGLVCLVLASFGFMAFWNRPEPILLLCVAVPVWMIASNRQWASFVAVGAALALALHLKVTGGLYLVPVIAFMRPLRNIGKTIAALSLAAALLAAPFLLQSVSLPDYLGTLRVAAAHGLDRQLFLENIQLAALLLLPICWCVLLRRRVARLSLRTIVNLAALVLPIAAVCVIGAKPGAGSHHLIPFVGILPYAFLWLRADDVSVVSARGSIVPILIPVAFTLLALGMTTMGVVLMSFPAQFREGKALVREVNSIVHDYPNRSIEMGYGESVYETATYFRCLLVFAGNPYTLDAIAVQELQFGGKSLPVATRRLLEQCHTEMWLIPKGEQPFAAHNGYNMEVPVFDSAFRRAFVDHYHHIESRQFFEVWGCTTEGKVARTISD